MPERNVKQVASNVAGTARDKAKAVASTAKDKAREAARIVREAEPDVVLQARARDATQHGLARAGDAVSGAAPAIGRGAEIAAGKVGAALRYAGRPLGAVIGIIAGTVGGWWNKASEMRSDLPPGEDEVCRSHFVALAIDGLSYDRARDGYTLGYIAGCNPDYGGRAFEEIETDLRHGFFEDDRAYDSLREFARYGYSRAAARRG